MKRHPLFIFAFFIFCFSISISQAQVTGVKYRLIYDVKRDLHDFYIHIVSGTSKSALQRAQFNSAVSFVVPNGTILNIVERYMPLKNNQNYNSTEPYYWDFTNNINSPASQPQSDFYYLSTTTLSSYYNDLYPGDSVRLFSLKVSNSTGVCGGGIRLYENGSDPDSSMPGMENADYSQGFLIGGGVQDYQGNLPNININQTSITSASLQKTTDGQKILSVNTNSNGALNYFWSGPSGFSTTNQNIVIPNIPQAIGTYTLTMIDSLQCSYSTKFLVEADIDSTCRNTTYDLSSQWGKGTWTSFYNNPIGATIINPTESAEVTFDTTAYGQYHFIFTNEQGDTYRKFVNIIPHTAVKPEIEEFLVCPASDPVQLKVFPSGGLFSGVGIIGSTFVPSVLGEGIYTINYTYNDGICGDTYDDYDVKIYQPNAGPDTTVCVGDFINIKVTPGSGKWRKLSGNGPTAWSSVSPDSYTFIFYSHQTGKSTYEYSIDSCRDTIIFNVRPLPIISISKDTICVGLTSQAFPSTGGTWTSSNPTIATISNSGLITAVSPGTTTLTFVSSTTGCVSNPTEPFTVVAGPYISYSGDSTLCIGETANLLSSSGGTWSVAPSFSTTVASITNDGTITALGAGYTRFVFKSTATGCKSEPSGPLTVNGKPIVFIDGPETICLGGNTKLFPSTGGTWEGNNYTVATVTANSGIVTGIGIGIASFKFTNNLTGCQSDYTSNVTVSEITINGIDNVCIGSLFSLFPPFNGTIEVLSDPSILIIENDNQIHAKGEGQGILKFTIDGGCEFIDTILVNPKPITQFIGSDTICEKEFSSVIANIINGTWTSSNTAVATLNNDGLITTYEKGYAFLQFTDFATGCSSDPLKITVNKIPIIQSNNTKSKIKGTIKFTSNSNSGVWKSSKPKIASINASGLVIGKSKGKTIIHFEDNNGCISNAIEIEVTDNDIIKPQIKLIDNSSNQILSDEELKERNQNEKEFGEMTLYPNPASQYLFIQSNETISDVEIFDLTGKIILKSPSKNEIDISTLANGFYQIKIETEEGEITRKNFIKNN